MTMHRKGSVHRMLSKVALVTGTAVVSSGIALGGAGIASAAPGDTLDKRIGDAGWYYNHQIGHFGTFINHQIGHAGTYYSINAGRAVKGLLNSLLGKNAHHH
jgi:hypothetical protein